jgi:AbrB family looped-hinge helix DNA binding protein
MRITTKGQVTIPQEIREKLGLLPHCEVEFDIVGSSVRIRKAAPRKKPGRGEMIVSRLRGTNSKRWRTNELMSLLRGESD